MKRLFDTVVSGMLTVVLAPFLFAIAGLVLLTSGPPILFRQQRIGLGGRPFTLYKFRTMRGASDTERPRAPKIDDWESYIFSLPGDSARTTSLGRVLRRSGLDELPQLWNILKGEMSLVGPRPELPEIVEQYPSAYHRRHNIRPGLTGAAQAISREGMTYAEIIRHDLDYVDNHSTWRDIGILRRTVAAVFRGGVQKR